MPKIQTIYISDEDLLKEAEKIRWRDKKSFSQLANKAIEEYVKHHKDGNEQYTLDDPVMATPSFYRPYTVWEGYVMKMTDAEESEFRFKLHELVGLYNKRFGEKLY